VWIPTVDERWLILPRYTKPSLDTKLLIEKLKIAAAEPAATAPGGAKRKLQNRGTTRPVGACLW